MRVAIIAIVALFAVSASAHFLSEAEYGHLFTKWMGQHNKLYETNDMFQYRYQVWKSNMDFIIGYNQANKTATMAMNKFGDLTREEFGRMNGYRPRPNRVRRERFLTTVRTTSIPQSIDWRTKGAVNPVQNQQSCGSCWAFSTCESTEGAWFLATGQLILLSPQELVDCGNSTGNAGCEGGLMDDGFQWIINNGGITSWADLPYQGADGSCPSPLPPVVAKITGYHDVPSGNEAELQAALAQQPVSVAIEADQAVFQFYSGGVINDASCGTNLDHGVLAVGYNLAANPPYYIVKNSWGTDWGLSGYVNIVANAASPANQCGIATDPSYPTASASAATQ